MSDIVTVHLGEGQDVSLPADIAASDDLIRKALSPFYPDVATAHIRRESQGGVDSITVIKRAGPKGADARVTINGLQVAVDLDPALTEQQIRARLAPWFPGLDSEACYGYESRMEQDVRVITFTRKPGVIGTP